MYNNFITEEYTEGIRLATEQPHKIKFISFSMALFFDDRDGNELHIYKLTKTKNEEWVCDCPHFRTMQEHWHPHPICHHIIAVSNILCGDYENMTWLHQSSKNSLVISQNQALSKRNPNHTTCYLGKSTFYHRVMAR